MEDELEVNEDEIELMVGLVLLPEPVDEDGQGGDDNEVLVGLPSPVDNKLLLDALVALSGLLSDKLPELLNGDELITALTLTLDDDTTTRSTELPLEVEEDDAVSAPVAGTFCEEVDDS